jgi:Ser/Thr protein kinase RdoA (MazF antagonist)
MNSTLTAVLENWADQFCQNAQITALGNAGGFSGANIWRISNVQQTFCLRRWPKQHPSLARLVWIHKVLFHVSQHSGLPLALPIPTTDGSSFVLHAGHLWELSLWLPGEPFPFLSESKSPLSSVEEVQAEPVLHLHLQKAMQTLAEFHRAASNCPFPEDGRHEKQPARGISPGLESRAERIQQILQPDYFPVLRANVIQENNVWPAGAALAVGILEKVGMLAPVVNAEVQAVLRLQVPLQPCVRDIWSDHLLFTAGEITGWVDFGAMRVETPSGDIARLLGSMAGDDPACWQAGLQAYEEIRPLSEQERRHVQSFDSCQVLLSGLNWIQWIFREQRTFEQLEPVEARLRNIDRRLSYQLRTPESLS